MATFGSGAHAQTLAGTVRVAPSVAPSYEPRTITFSGVWINGCTPVAGAIRAEPPLDPKVITIELLNPPTLGPCTQAITPYETTFSFTPASNGTLAVIAKFGNEIVGVGTMIVGAAPPADSHNLTGMWLDWSRPASIVHLSHSETSGSITGLVGAYRSDGTPTWWVLHSSSRTGTNSYVAKVSEYVAEERQKCTPPVAFGMCDGLSVKSEKNLGTMQITVHSKDVVALLLRPECLFTCAPGFNPEYRGVLSRFVY